MTGSPATDVAALVRAAAAGDQAAWNGLVERFGNLVWAVARAHRLQGDDAADVFQTTWLRLVEHLPRLREPERVGAWLATTARHECLRVIRRSGRETAREPELLDLTPDDGPEVSSRLVTAERDTAVWHALRNTTGRCRELLGVLLAEPPLSYTEVSELLGMPIGSIGPTRRRCLEKLRRDLAEVGVHDRS
ncbi:RNA polymerase sigma factor [Modestobacter roseus]|uniref:RNA polymerase sigma factor (Sigma-70 family) n=1 Tax=Modestobacter roseus TaxID=1181884 RepID=A0A562IRQ0_9ACTN|nr:sigma-70 family RNA polymerase sigma factor [Modestobacter roseus]MQA35466.1 sigma-70 family RNA polymerase sigma factor [Modestobacter roseus]TWH73582.1 RNA polymerase sigma factor (sigma-70 family) [Modestobacter roseus]